jgi:hypothetical protein
MWENYQKVTIKTLNELMCYFVFGISTEQFSCKLNSINAYEFLAN